MKTSGFNIASPMWLLTFLFVMLRVTGVINWSLWWVFSPVLIIYGIILLPFIVLATVAALSVIVAVFDEFLRRITK